MIIGRKKEIKELWSAYEADNSRFIAVYGRRRVGKTFLVREVFKNRLTFSYSGMANVSTKKQLQKFYLTLKHYGFKNGETPSNWITAFDMLERYLESLPKGKKVVFLDELPWMDAPRSSFLPAFENFWNDWASARNDILLIVCGSATSWIMNKILRNRGGLHNRLTDQIHLMPFNLYECEEYSDAYHLPFGRKDILEAYMVMGGVPFYWSLLQPDLTLTQNIDQLFFGRNPKLKNEFQTLYSSLFKNPEPYIKLITLLGKKSAGLSRADILLQTRETTSGTLSRRLEELEECGFIRRYQTIGASRKNSVYQLIDNYTLFYFRFLDGKKITDSNYWQKIQIALVYHTWCGIAFERVCLLHSDQIKMALGIGGVISNEYSWRVPAKENSRGAQIDLLIDRSDHAINLCEIKYYNGLYAMDQNDYDNLMNKLNRFREETRTRSGIALTMITSFGMVQNKYTSFINNQITSDALFVNC